MTTSEGSATATVYVNGEPHERIQVSPEEIAVGWTTATCPACEGSGVFCEGDPWEGPCVECSTSGEVMVSIRGTTGDGTVG